MTAPAIPEAFLPKFEKMWHAACRVCDQVRAFQPDVVLALMHSGWGPVFAGRVLWQQTMDQPFPPLARTNLGREKITLFEEAVNLPNECFAGEYSGDLAVGKLLAWLHSRADWQAQLREQVSAALGSGSAPQRILVVDDTVHEGSTMILTFGLLDVVFPQAEVCFLNASGWYRSDYRDFMLAALMDGASFLPERKQPYDELYNQLACVAIGSDDEGDTLFWQPVTPSHPALQALSGYRPAAEWLQASQAIYAALAAYIAGRASAAPPPPAPPVEANLNYVNYGLRAGWLIMRDVWLEGAITLRQIEQRHRLDRREAVELLERWQEWGELAPQGNGRGRRYVIPAGLQKAVERSAGDEEDQDPTAGREAYWLVPGRLMVGDQPWYTDNPDHLQWARRDVCALLEQGVDAWLDVQVIRDGEQAKENPLFHREAQALGRAANQEVLPLALEYVTKENYIKVKHGRPNRKDIRRVLDRLDELLAEGRVVYLSASSRRLLGVLAGCHLARHGQSGAAALEALQARRATGANGWKREPAERQARRYVRSWPAGM